MNLFFFVSTMHEARPKAKAIVRKGFTNRVLSLAKLELEGDVQDEVRPPWSGLVNFSKSLLVGLLRF